MKRFVFLLSCLFLAFVLISGRVNNAFARGGSRPPTAVADLVCSLSAPAFVVNAYSSANVTNVTVATDGSEGCAQALADLLNAGLNIKNVQTIAPNVVLYTVANRSED